jgi:hypothetical protein
VHHPDHPPRLNPAEITRDPANDTYWTVWGKSNGAAGKAEKDRLPQNDINTVLTTVLEKSSSFDPKLGELWEKTAKERDELSKELAEKNAPADVLSLVKGVKDLFPTPPAPAARSENSDLLAIITAIKNLQQDPIEVMQRAKESFAPVVENHEPHRDEIDRLDKVLGFAQKLAAIRTPAGGSRSGWDVVSTSRGSLALLCYRL